MASVSTSKDDSTSASMGSALDTAVENIEIDAKTKRRTKEKDGGTGRAITEEENKGERKRVHSAAAMDRMQQAERLHHWLSAFLTQFPQHDGAALFSTAYLQTGLGTLNLDCYWAKQVTERTDRLRIGEDKHSPPVKNFVALMEVAKCIIDGRKLSLPEHLSHCADSSCIGYRSAIRYGNTAREVVQWLMAQPLPDLSP